jgi:hypothetical protein
MSAVFGIALAIVTLLVFSQYDEATVLCEAGLDRISTRGGDPAQEQVTGYKDGAGDGSRSGSRDSVGWSARSEGRSEGEGWWARGRAGRGGRWREAGGLPTSNAREIRPGL